MSLKIAKVIAIIMLLWALADNPYNYYVLLRWVVCGVTGYAAYMAYNNKIGIWVYVFGAIALLFNPILPFYLDRGTWMILDVVVAIIIFTSILKANKL